MVIVGFSIPIFAEETSFGLNFIKTPIPDSTHRFGNSISQFENKLAVSGDPNNIYVYDLSSLNLEKIFRVVDYSNYKIIGFNEMIGFDNNKLFIQVLLDDNESICVNAVAMIDYESGKLIHLFTDTINVSNISNNGSVSGYPIYELKEKTCSQTFAQSSDGIDIYGNYLVVSAPSGNGKFEDGTNRHWVQKSHVFLFDTASGNLLKTFEDPTPHPIPTDYNKWAHKYPHILALTSFGQSVSINENYLVVGAPSTPKYIQGEASIEVIDPSIGEVYVYELPSGNLLHTIHGSEERNSFFGGSVFVSNNGIFVREHIQTGKIFQFNEKTGELLRIITNPTERGIFGMVMDEYGDNILISSFENSNYISRGSITGTEEQQDTIVDTIRGKVFMFDLDGKLIKTFKNPDSRPGHLYGANLWTDSFGESQSVSKDFIVISAPSNSNDKPQLFVYYPTSSNLLKPKIITPNDITVYSDSQNGVIVDFEVTAEDYNRNKIIPKCLPISGSLFLKGTETITCTVSDSGENTATSTFDVTVKNSSEDNTSKYKKILCPQGFESINGKCPDKPVIEPTIDSNNLEIASFVDKSKDPKSYVDRYNNEPNYKKWFHENYPQYKSIEQAVGLELTEKIPEWVKNIFGWYASDQVSEDELLNAIKYLISQEILIVN